jgi:regulatory protein
MPRVTALRAAFRGSKRRSIHIDGEEWRTTSAAVIRELGLSQDDEVDLRELEAALSAAEPVAARERALRLLGYREHGSKELHTKLTDDGYPAAVAAAVTDSLVRVGLVDDERYTSLLARTLIEGRGYGRSRAYREMTRRGISEDDAGGCLDALCSESTERTRALELARKWARPGADVRKLAARLARRGFAMGICFEAASAAVGACDHEPPDDDF